MRAGVALNAVTKENMVEVRMWRFRHWLTGKLIRIAIRTMPESEAKRLLCEALREWGQYTMKLLQAAEANVAQPDRASVS